MGRVTGMAQKNEDVQRELGRLSEAMDNAKDDRQELRRAVEKLSEAVGEMRAEFRGLNQTMQSTAVTIANLTADKCGQRLDKIEAKNKHYDRILGTANSFVWKVAMGFVGAAVLGAGGLRLLEVAL